jgi:hypothetical protein
MKNVLFGLSLSLLLVLSGCKSKDTASESSTGTEVSENAAITKGHRYGIKSGVIIYKAPMGMVQTLYFDDYGNKETMITEMEMAGMSIKTTDIRKGGYSYNFKAGESTGIKSVWNFQDQNYDKFDPEIAKQYKLKDMGTENLAGKSCRKYSMEMGSTPTKAWIWNGLLIKSETTMMGKEFIIEATKIEEGPVSDEVFELPENVTFNQL